MSALTENRPPRVGADGRLRPRVEIACSWAEGEHGLDIEAINLAPAPKSREHKPHRISVYNGLLICDCHQYEFSRWHPAQPKECSHLTGNDGLDGVAAWLEVQSKRRDLTPRQRAIIAASHADPHRAYVRAERTRRRLAEQFTPATARQDREAEGGPQRALAARGITLEKFFES